ncbi:MAG: hypothetical protein ACSHXK_05660 [Oceanococcus sp.]
MAVSLLGLFAASPLELMQLAPWRLKRLIDQMAAGDIPTSDSKPSALSGRIAFSATAPVIGHIRAITNYRQTMDQLLGQAKLGDRESLRKAIKCDPAVLLVRPASRELALASYIGDRKQLAWLSSAIRDSKEFDSDSNGYARIVVQLMHETGQLEKLTKSSSQIIFIERTKLYRSTGDNPPDVTLWANIQNWREEARKNSEPVFSSRMLK